MRFNLSLDSEDTQTSRRKLPTRQLLLELCGSNSDLLGSTHHGLYETPSLRNVYPFLDLDELVAFAASSWRSREKNPNFKHHVEHDTLYDLFSHVYQIGFAWLNKNRRISQYRQNLYEELNPFNGRDIKARLSSVQEQLDEKLRCELARPVHDYVFECQYQEMKALHGGDNSNIEIMEFQAVYPKRENIASAYAAEVSSMVRSFPTEYHKLQQEPVPLSKPKPERLSLFPK